MQSSEKMQGGGMGSRFIHPAVDIPGTAGVAGSPKRQTGDLPTPCLGSGLCIALDSKTPGKCQEHCPSPCKSLCHGNSPSGVEK